MNLINATPDAPILLGRQGEKNVTRVEFDLLLFVQQYGEGTVQLYVRRAGETEVYPAEATRSGNTAVWDIGEEWTGKAGRGYCELQWYVGDKLAKSEVYRTEVETSLQGEVQDGLPAVPPSYTEMVVDAVLAALPVYNGEVVEV